MNLRVLFDLRTALDGFAGVPQETRLIFRALADLPDVALTGLVQSGGAVLPAAGRPAADVMQALRAPTRPAALLQQAALVATQALRGRAMAVSALRPDAQEEALWQALFSKTLGPHDRTAVMQTRFAYLGVPRAAQQAVSLATGWTGHALFAPVATDDTDVFIATTPFPGRIAGRARLLVRYYDAFPVTMAHRVQHGRLHGAAHLHALRRNADDGAWFVCCSEASRADLLSLVPSVQHRSLTIPCMVSDHYQAVTEGPERIAALLGLAEPTPRYLLMVSTLEPRKNHLTLLDAWERLRATGWPDLRLVLVGGKGWRNEDILARMQPARDTGALHHLQGVSAETLRLLYRHATFTVAPSLAEGFDLSGIESMRSGGVVVASDIAVHREVYADAAAYFPATDARALAALLDDLLSPAAHERVESLRGRGSRVASHYLPQALAPSWADLLRRVAAG